METTAYNLAVEGKCTIGERETKKISMVELFDMIAGSETGSIIATAISVEHENQGPNVKQTNKYFADSAVKFFEEEVDVLYHNLKVSFAFQFLIWFIVLVIPCAFIFNWVEKKCIKEGFEEELEGLSDCIRIRKEKLLGKDVDESQFQKYSVPISIPELEKISNHVEIILPFSKFKEFNTPLDKDVHLEAEQRMEQLLE